MTEILEELHRYVPEDGNKLLKVFITWGWVCPMSDESAVHVHVI